MQLKENLLCFNRTSTLSNSVVICLTKLYFGKSSVLKLMVVSSAYILHLKVSLMVEMSLIQILNYEGPKMYPCGTPVLISLNSDSLTLYLTYCFLFDI